MENCEVGKMFPEVLESTLPTEIILQWFSEHEVLEKSMTGNPSTSRFVILRLAGYHKAEWAQKDGAQELSEHPFQQQPPCQ